MLFQIHGESKISIKRLTDADLKRSPTSHQTHIGLSNNSLTFMTDNKTEYTAMLIYNSMCDFMPCEVGKILRQNDSPNNALQDALPRFSLCRALYNSE